MRYILIIFYVLLTRILWIMCNLFKFIWYLDFKHFSYYGYYFLSIDYVGIFKK